MICAVSSPGTPDGAALPASPGLIVPGEALKDGPLHAVFTRNAAPASNTPPVSVDGDGMVVDEPLVPKSCVNARRHACAGPAVLFSTSIDADACPVDDRRRAKRCQWWCRWSRVPGFPCRRTARASLIGANLK